MSKNELRFWLVAFLAVIVGSVAYLGFQLLQIESELSSIAFHTGSLSP